MKWMQSLRRTLLLAILLATVAPMAVPEKAAAQSGQIEWITDLRQAREIAERQNRLVLLHFWSETCPPCKSLEHGVFNRPEFIRALTTGYVPVKINVNQQAQLAEFYNIESIPTDVVVTPSGRELKRFQSLQDPNQYIAVLDGIRAHSAAGHLEPASSDSSPVAARIQSNRVTTSRYGNASVPQNSASRYGKPNVAMTPGSTETISQDRYATPFTQPTQPQQQPISSRYANPYNEPPSTNDNTAGSRQSQPIAGYGATNATNAQPPTAPQTNSFANPIPGFGQSSPSSSTLNPNASRQPIQNPMLGNSTPQLGYGVGTRPQQAQTQPHTTANESQFSLEGYCPVTLVNDRVWTPGDRRWGAVHEGRTYLFAGPEQQQQFMANPNIYAPLMAGYDPVRFAETGQLVAGHREFGLYLEGPAPIALFADEASLQRFNANAGYYVDAVQQARTQQAGQATR